MPARQLDQHVDSRCRRRPRWRRGPAGRVTQAVAPVMVHRGPERTPQRRLRTLGEDRAWHRTTELAEPPRVDAAELHRHVARDRRERLDRELRRAPGQEQRQRVVDPGIGVDDGGRHASTAGRDRSITRTSPACKIPETLEEGGISHGHRNPLLRRVKLPTPGLQSAGRHQEQVRHHRVTARGRRRDLRGVDRQRHRLHEPGHVPVPERRGDLREDRRPQENIAASTR